MNKTNCTVKNPFSLKFEINYYGHLFLTFSCCERSNLPMIINVLHRIYIVLLIFR